MKIHYYMSVFPVEALIASELDPDAFGVYMAVGSRRGSSEPHAFIEVDEGGLADSFDLAYAEKKCATKGKEEGKRSVYLSIYRTLENIPLDSMGTLYLVTRDGRCLPLQPERLEGPTQVTKQFYLYQELSPVRPAVVTKYAPTQFSDYITSVESKIHVPKIAFADLRVIDLDNLDDSGNIGSFYHRNIAHLQNCIESVMNKPEKFAKTLDRARVETFTYNLIDSGVYVGDQSGVLFYRMPSLREFRMHHYPWAKSALLV